MGVTSRPAQAPGVQGKVPLFTRNGVNVPSEALSASLIPPQLVDPHIRLVEVTAGARMLLVGVGDPAVGPGAGALVGLGDGGSVVGLRVGPGVLVTGGPW